MSDAFAKAWYLLKQISLTPDEERLTHLADKRIVSSGLGSKRPMLQSNLGLFDPKLTLTSISRDDMRQVPIRIGLGERKEINKPIESQYVSVKHLSDGNINYRLMGVPTDGKAHVEMSSLTGLPEGTREKTLTGLSGNTPKEYQRQGNYQKLLQAILASGIGVESDNRNRLYSNPFHEKFLSRYKDLYSPDINRHGDAYSNMINPNELKLFDKIVYNPPTIQNGKTVIEQKPQRGVNPKGGFGSLARYDFGALPMRRNVIEEKKFSERNPESQNTEQTLLTEGYLANLNRGRLEPQDIESFMVHPQSIYYSNTKPPSLDMAQQVPFYDEDFTRTLSPEKLAIGASAAFPNHQMVRDLTTGKPVLVAQPLGKIANAVKAFEEKNKVFEEKDPYDFGDLSNLWG